MTCPEALRGPGRPRRSTPSARWLQTAVWSSWLTLLLLLIPGGGASSSQGELVREAPAEDEVPGAGADAPPEVPDPPPGWDAADQLDFAAEPDPEPILLAEEETAPSERCTAEDFPLPNADLEEPEGLDGCPAGMAPVYDLPVCIDRWEAHLAEVLEDGSLQPWSPFFNPRGHRVLARSAPGAVPQGYINEVQAAAACAEAGKRLCTEPEWSAACRGPERNVYPFGTERQPGVCNDARFQHPAVEFFQRTDQRAFDNLNHPCLNQLARGLARTGAYEGCVTPGGVHDLMGNLHEWVADPAGTFRGGFYVDTIGNGPGCLYRTSAHNATYSDYSTGFRCCADVP